MAELRLRDMMGDVCDMRCRCAMGDADADGCRWRVAAVGLVEWLAELNGRVGVGGVRGTDEAVVRT